MSKTITISIDDNVNDDDYNEGEEEEEEVKKPIKFDYNLKHSQAVPETFARQKCNLENAICWRWRISMKTLQRQMIKI